MTRILKQGLLAIPGIGVSLLPKLMCPACWPAYTALLSSIGLAFLVSPTHLLFTTTGFLMLAVGSLAFRASARHGLGPFGLGIIAAALILVGKFYLDSDPATYSGVAVLIIASVWNTWPHRPTAVACCEYVFEETTTEHTKGNSIQ